MLIVPPAALTAATTRRRRSSHRDDERERGEANANRPPNVPAWSAISFTSTIGPDDHERQAGGERELRQARGDERVGLGADRHHDREAGEREHSRGAESGDRVEDAARHDRLQRRCGRGADDQESARMQQVVLRGLDEHGERRSLVDRAAVARDRGARRVPNRAQTSPTTVAASRLARNRAATISGWPGNATAVETSTTGLIAGADSRNVSAAAGMAPRETSRPAIGTEPHSHPGRAAPATAATGTANAGRSGSTRGRKSPGHERRDRRADGDAEHEERHRLHRDRDEDRRPMRDGGLVEQVLQQRAKSSRSHDHQDDDGDARIGPAVAPVLVLVHVALGGFAQGNIVPDRRPSPRRA